MPVIKSFSDAQPDHPTFDFEVRGLSSGSKPLSLIPYAGVFQGETELAQVMRGLANPMAEIYGPGGTTEYRTRLVPLLHSPTANFMFRRSPMLEIIESGSSTPVAAFWFHEHRLPDNASAAPHRFRLLPCDGFQNRAYDLNGRLILKLHDAWRDSDRERGVLFGVESVDPISLENTLFAVLGLLMVRREVSMQLLLK